MLVEYKSHIYILVLNEIWVEWVSEIWGSITIYDKSELGNLFADELKWKNGTRTEGVLNIEEIIIRQQM